MRTYRVPIEITIKADLIVRSSSPGEALELAADKHKVAASLPRLQKAEVTSAVPKRARACKSHFGQNIHISQQWMPELSRSICKRCKAQCCEFMAVSLDYELAMGTEDQYEHEKETKWGQKRALVLKNSDGSCIYFDKEKRECSIYDTRPQACKAFFCGRGTEDPRVWKRIKEAEKEEAKKKKERLDDGPLCTKKIELVEKEVAPHLHHLVTTRGNRLSAP